MSLPKWVEKWKQEYTEANPVNDLIEAIAIAVEALEHFKWHSGRTVYQYEDEAKEALRRIEEIGQ